MRLLPTHPKEEGVKLPGNAVYHVRIFAVKERHRTGITYVTLLFLAMQATELKTLPCFEKGTLKINTPNVSG